MNKHIYKTDSYSLWLIDKGSLYDASKFIVETNYKRHQGDVPDCAKQETEAIAIEESKYYAYSYFYVAKNNTEEIVGSVRALHWNDSITLPFQKKYNVDLEKLMETENANEVWHIGRLAVDVKSLGRASVVLLKTLLVQAFAHACKSTNSLIVAECDYKLFEKINYLNVHPIKAGDIQLDLGSATVPAYSTSNNLKEFICKNKSLLYTNETDSIYRTKSNNKSRITKSYWEEQV